MVTIVSTTGILTVTRGGETFRFVEPEGEYGYSSDGKLLYLALWGKKYNRRFQIQIKDVEINETTPANALECSSLLDEALSEASDLGGSGGGSSYLVYTALLTQSGTNAPVSTVLGDNTLGNIVWTRNAMGDYRGTLMGAFPSGKTLIFSGFDYWNSVPALLEVGFVSTNEIVLYTAQSDTVAVDLGGTMWVKIEVHP